LKNGGLPTGGLNFDSKVRRQSFEASDLFYAHIAGMDTYAAGLRVAAKLLEDGVLEDIVKERYASFDEGIGADFEAGKVTFADFENYVLDKTDDEILASVKSGRLEQIKSTVNNYIYSVLGA